MRSVIIMILKAGEHMSRITDQYGNKKGSIEKRGDDYIVRDNLGFKEGSVEKDFLSNDYTFYDNRGQKRGRIEKDFIGNGSTIKNSSGHKIGSITPTDGMSTGLFLLLLAIGIIVYCSLDSIPKNLIESLDINSFLFLIITAPNLIFLAYNIFCIVRKQGFVFSYSGNFLMTLLTEVFCGAAIFLGACIVVGIVGIVQGESVIEIILMVPMMVLFYGTTALVEVIPIAFICSIIIRSTKK